jgi:hypothetical protein
MVRNLSAGPFIRFVRVSTGYPRNIDPIEAMRSSSRQPQVEEVIFVEENIQIKGKTLNLLKRHKAVSTEILWQKLR